jgi:hypothetical protein
LKIIYLIIKLDIACKYFFENGKKFHAYSKLGFKFANEMQDKTGEPKENIIPLRALEKLYTKIP